MNAHFFLALTLLALPCFSGDRHVSPGPITLYAQFDQKPAPEIETALHDELTAIMGPIGMRFEWRALDRVTGGDVSAELVVVSFKGNCDVHSPARPMHGPGALGWTHVSEGSILPFSDVDCNRIRAFLQRELLGMPVVNRLEAYGRALGRVVAHELYHIFANTSRHGSCGVGKAAYTVQELLSEEFQFEGRESEALRHTSSNGTKPSLP